MRAIFTQKYSQNQERFVGKTNSLRIYPVKPPKNGLDSQFSDVVYQTSKTFY